MLRGCLVSVICNSNSIHSFIFKLFIMIVHTLKMCTLYFMHISQIHFSFLGVLNLDIFSLEMLGWFLFFVICHLSSFHSFIIKLCINMYTLYLCPFDNIFLSVYCRYHCEIWMKYDFIPVYVNLAYRLFTH